MHPLGGGKQHVTLATAITALMASSCCREEQIGWKVRSNLLLALRSVVVWQQTQSINITPKDLIKLPQKRGSTGDS